MFTRLQEAIAFQQQEMLRQIEKASSELGQVKSQVKDAAQIPSEPVPDVEEVVEQVRQSVIQELKENIVPPESNVVVTT
jgi:hypothetical protein